MKIYFWKGGDYNYNNNPPLISSFSKMAKGKWLLFMQLKYSCELKLRDILPSASCSVHRITTYLKRASVVFQQVKEKSMPLSYHSQALKNWNWQMLLPKNIELFLVAWGCNIQRLNINYVTLCHQAFKWDCKSTFLLPVCTHWLLAKAYITD